MELASLFNNPALMGLIGVLGGALISFWGVIHSENVKLEALKREQEFKGREKREAVYQHFLEVDAMKESLKAN